MGQSQPVALCAIQTSVTHDVAVTPSIVDIAGSLGVRTTDRLEKLIALLDRSRLDEVLLHEPIVQVRVGPGRVDVVATICERASPNVSPGQ